MFVVYKKKETIPHKGEVLVPICSGLGTGTYRVISEKISVMILSEFDNKNAIRTVLTKMSCQKFVQRKAGLTGRF
jgi:hypothetical protein